MSVNVPGLAAGIVALLASLVFGVLAYSYYHRLTTPASKGLAFRILLSSLLGVVGSLGVIVDSVTRRSLWWIMASAFLVSYLVIMVSAVHYLKLSVQLFGQPRSSPAPGRNPAGRKVAKLPVTGGFSVDSKHLPKITPLCELVNGVVYVGRKQRPQICERADKVLWLTRVEAPNSVDPSKLHVLMEKVMRFVSERGGGCLIILDGLEYLLLHNDFKGLMKFLAAMKDYVLLSNSLLIVVADEATLGKRELSVLKREFPEFDVEEFLSKVEGRALFGVLSREALEEEVGGEEEEGEAG